MPDWESLLAKLREARDTVDEWKSRPPPSNPFSGGTDKDFEMPVVKLWRGYQDWREQNKREADARRREIFQPVTTEPAEPEPPPPAPTELDFRQRAEQNQAALFRAMGRTPEAEAAVQAKRRANLETGKDLSQIWNTPIAETSGVNAGQFIIKWMNDKGQSPEAPSPPVAGRTGEDEPDIAQKRAAYLVEKRQYDANLQAAYNAYRQQEGAGNILRYGAGELASMVAGQLGKMVAPGEKLTVGEAVEGALYVALLAQPQLKAIGSKAFTAALSTGLDKWIATQGRILPEARSLMGDLLVTDQDWLVRTATDNLKRRMAEGKGAEAASSLAVADTVNAVTEKLKELAQSAGRTLREAAVDETGAIGRPSKVIGGKTVDLATTVKPEVPVVKPAVKPQEKAIPETPVPEPAGAIPPGKPPEPPTAVSAAPEFGKGVPEGKGLKSVSVKGAKPNAPVTPLVSDIAEVDLPNQLRATHREVLIDVDTVREALKGKTDVGSRLTKAILKDTERQLSHADNLLGQIETGGKVSAERIATLQERLVKQRELFKKSIQTEQDVKQLLTLYAKETLPPEVRGKVLTAIKNAKTENDLYEVIGRIEKLSELTEKKSIISDISKIDTTDLPEPYKTKISDLLSDFDTKFRSDQFITKLEGTRDYAARLADEGLPINIPDKLLDLVKRTRLQDLTIDQLNILKNELNGLVHQAKLKNKLIKIQADRRVDNAVKELTDHLGVPPPVGAPITAETTNRSFRQRVLDQISAVDARFNRVENILYQYDRYDDEGKLWKFFYEPVDKATNAKLTGVNATMEEFRAMLKGNGIDLAQTLKGTSKIGDTVITPSEKIGVYLHSLNEDNLRHLQIGNGFTDDMISNVVSSLTPQEKAIADWIHNYFTKSGAEISKVRTLVEGKSLSVVKDYFPIIVNWEADAVLDVGKRLAEEEAARFSSKWASAGINKSFLKERTHKAIQPVHLDAMNIFLDRLEAFEHYKNFAPVIRDIQLVQKSAEFKSAFVNRAGKANYDVLDKWIKQVAETNPLMAGNFLDSKLAQMRVNAVTATLGLNITTAMKQPVSFFTGMSEIGELPAMKGMFNYLRDPKGTTALIKQYGVQIFNRSFEREIAEAKIMKSIASRVNQVMSVKEVFTLLSTATDKFAVSTLWRGAFDDALAKGMTPEAAGQYATKAIRKTQAFFSVKDLPEAYRSGEFMKGLTIFTNELNNQYQQARYRILGKTGAGKQSVPKMLLKIFEGIVIPAMLIGMISRSRPAQDAKEVAEDIGNQGLAMIPILGNLIGLGYQNYYGNNLVSTELLTKINELGFRLNKGEWQKVLKDMPEMAGYAVGIPVVQPERTIRGIVDLATHKTNDWQRLIWSEYARNRAVTPKEKLDNTLTQALPKLGQPDTEALEKKIEKATSPEMKAYIREHGDIYSTTDLGAELRSVTKDLVLAEMNPDKFAPIVYAYKKAEQGFARYEGIPPDKRDNFRRENPTIDAQLFFWGKVTATKTAEAQEIAEGMIQGYGIPENAVPGMKERPDPLRGLSLPGRNIPTGRSSRTRSGLVPRTSRRQRSGLIPRTSRRQRSGLVPRIGVR